LGEKIYLLLAIFATDALVIIAKIANS